MKARTFLARQALILIACLAMMMAMPASADPTYLVKNGKSAYSIVVSAAASASEQKAAQELQSHVKACTGVQLPIVNESPAENAPMIVLGCGAVAQKLGVDPAPQELGEQGYVLRTVTPHVVIAGTPAAGTLYGVYDFLETQFGVRWYAPGVTKTPGTKQVALRAADKTVRPAFAWRHTSYEWPGGDPDFLARQRDNSGAGGADCPQGIQYTFDGTCHSYFRYISPDEFFDTHPEYFSEIGGVRRRDETQLCLTNPEVLEIVTQRMLQRMAEAPGVRQHNFSQMDYYNYCQCAKCKAINDQYGSLGGTQFWFVNQLAERTSKQFPDKLIGTLAYMYTEQAPKDMTMHPNVAVWLCHMYPSCDSHPIATCPLNGDYKRRAEEWAKLCKHLYIWHYIVDFAHYYNPFPNFRAMAADMRFYQDIGVEGIYLQGMGHKGGGGEFSLLRPYYGVKLLWNPKQDADALMRDFLQGYYGAAWEPIWKYITLIHNKVEREDIHMHLYTNPGQGYLPDRILRIAGMLFNQAEQAVQNDPELLERVRVARMPLTYARIFPRNGYKLADGNLHFLGDRANMEETKAFIERMKQHEFTTIREWGGDPKQLEMLTLALSLPLNYVTVKNAQISADILPILGGRVLRITDLKSNQSVTAYDTVRNLFFPFCGGEEARVGGMFAANMGGNMELYNVVDKNDQACTIEAKVIGHTLRRTIAVDPNEPALTITDAITNDSDAVVVLPVRSHLELDMGALEKTKFRFTSLAGEAIERDLPTIIAGMREGEYFRNERVPNGAWVFSGTKGLDLTQRWNPETVDFTQVYAYPATLNDVEVEIWGKPLTINPKETGSFSFTLDVRPTAAK